MQERIDFFQHLRFGRYNLQSNKAKKKKKKSKAHGKLAIDQREDDSYP